MTMTHEVTGGQELLQERVAFVGRLAGMSRRDAQRLVREHGGVALDQPDATATLVVVGDEELPLGGLDGSNVLLDEAVRQAAEQGDLRILYETQLWQRLGLVEDDQHARRLYTPAMLARLLEVPVAVVRRWHRKGLIVPVREVRRLPYFDFQEVSTARRLAELVAAGCSPAVIERKLAELSRYLPTVQRPLAQLSVIVQGKQLLLRQGDGLIEPGGQLRFDFEATDDEGETAPGDLEEPETQIVSMSEISAEDSLPATPQEIVALACELEDQGQLAAAADAYRAALSLGGPDAEVSFSLAEVLYRLGDLGAARERYYFVIELDEDFVEARANLGCVLAETGQHELAVAAFQGALTYHDQYPDVHYHLARTLDELHKPVEAEQHWRAFLELAADSPWAVEAQQRLDVDV